MNILKKGKYKMASLKMIEKGNWKVSFYCKQYNEEKRGCQVNCVNFIYSETK